MEFFIFTQIQVIITGFQSKNGASKGRLSGVERTFQMKRVVMVVFASTLCLVMTTAAAAQEEVVDPVMDDPAPAGYSMHVIGATMNLGMATMIVENCANCSVRFAGGGNAHYNLYLAKVFAIHAGIEFMGRGLKASGFTNTTSEDEQKIKIIYLDIPIGIKLRFSSFQLALGVSLDFALSGKSENPDADFADADWELWARRFNLGAWMSLGWAIHAGPIDIIPGFSWNMHILDEVTMANANNSIRPFNLMFDLGVEFGI